MMTTWLILLTGTAHPETVLLRRPERASVLQIRPAYLAFAIAKYKTFLFRASMVYAEPRKCRTRPPPGPYARRTGSVPVHSKTGGPPTWPLSSFRRPRPPPESRRTTLRHAGRP